MAVKVWDADAPVSDTFGDAVRRMEQRKGKVRAWVIMDPAPREPWHVFAGKILAHHGTGGTCHIVAWLPGLPDGRDVRIAGSAGGGGYDKIGAMLFRCPFYSKTGERLTIDTEGSWAKALEDAGYRVQQVV